MQHLRLSAGGRGADRRVFGQLQQLIFRRFILANNEPIRRIFAVADGGNHQALGRVCRHIFHGMHCQIHVTAQQRIFDFFGKKAFAFHFRKTDILNTVALRFDDDEFDLRALLFEQKLGIFGLPKGEFRAACAYFYLQIL